MFLFALGEHEKLKKKKKKKKKKKEKKKRKKKKTMFQKNWKKNQKTPDLFHLHLRLQIGQFKHQT